MAASDTLDALQRFFATAPAAREATRPLSRDARVGLVLDGAAARFTMESGEPRVVAGAEPDPDFTIDLPAEAVRRITGAAAGGVGEVGIAFFELVLERDPAARVRVRLDAPTSRLLARGYLGVLARGGVRVALWLLRKGARSPRAAIERLRARGKRADRG